MLRHFPPRTLPELAAQRDVLLAYAKASPAAVLGGYCAAYVLMQVGCRQWVTTWLPAPQLQPDWHSCLLKPVLFWKVVAEYY